MTVQYIENRIDDLEQNFNTLSHSLDNLWDRFCKFEKQLESQHHEDRILNLEDMARDDADKMDRLAEGFDKFYEEMIEKTATKPQVQQTMDEFVRIVRCKDCKWYNGNPTEYDMCENEYGMFRPRGDDYCSKGEKKCEVAK